MPYNLALSPDIYAIQQYSQRIQERQGGGGTAECQDRLLLRGVPVGEEDGGPAAGAQLEQLPLPAAPATGGGRVTDQVPLPGGHAGQGGRLAHVLPELWCPHCAQERAD